MKMITDISTDLKGYEQDFMSWSSLIGLKVGDYIASSAGWKVADLKQFNECCIELLAVSSQMHVGDVNDRKIGSFLLKDRLPFNIPVVKLMQLRPGSSDVLRLDHVDFTVKDLAVIEQMLKQNSCKYEWQSNDAHKWLSVIIQNNREAKFVDHTVLDVCARELLLADRELTQK